MEACRLNRNYLVSIVIEERKPTIVFCRCFSLIFLGMRRAGVGLQKGPWQAESAK